jgi:hypothetical protein
METEEVGWLPDGTAVFFDMVLLRKWSGRQALAGLVACLVTLQAFVAGLHAARIVDLHLLANDLASICHGGTSGTGAPTQPSSDHADTCCLAGCGVVEQTARPPDATVFPHPPLRSSRVVLVVYSLALLPTHLIDRANRPRSPPIV